MHRDFARRVFDVTAWTFGFAFSLFLVADAIAGSHAAPAPANPVYASECGGCHVPYAPRLLAAPAWERIVAGLPRHFGVDASVDAETAAALRTWLTANAQPAGGKRYEPDVPRITQAQWYVREHRKVLARAGTGGAPAAGNCGACHPGAAAGSFDEHDVRLPRA
ncbi:MAG: cytochrome C [Burkholderiales bacterium]